jgi:cell wall-associated NlpC family hydrolase
MNPIPCCVRLLVTLLAVGCCGCRLHTEPERPGGQRAGIVNLAVSLVGVPYDFGGSDIDGFDCSGFVQYVYGCFGLDLPRTASEQRDVGRRISAKKALPGDLVLFKMGGIWHSAIYLGGGRFIHAPSRGSRVRIEELNDFWQGHLKRFTRLIAE